MLQTASNSRGKTGAALGALLAMSLFATSFAAADTRKDTFEMTVIRDAMHGGKVASGKHNEAIEKINARTVRESMQFYANTNLCVAYTKTGELDAAEAACGRAVALTDRGTPVQAHRTIMAHRMIERRYRAMALSNRGVLRAVSGDDRGALTDFRAAVDLNAGLSAPARNLVHLNTKTAESVTSLQTDLHSLRSVWPARTPPAGRLFYS